MSAVTVERVSKLGGAPFSNIYGRDEVLVRNGSYADGSPRFRSTYYVRGEEGSRPVPARCPTPSRFNGANCKRRKCPHCGKGWVASWEAITKHNIGALGGSVVLLSLTAPGADRLPWSCGKDHQHSGSRGCRVKSDYADDWADRAPGNWKRLRDAARWKVKAAGLPTAALVLQRVWEPQKRGVPHLHIVAGARTPLEREAVERFHAELVRLAPEYGFGPQLHVTKPMTGAEAARYLAGYLLGRSRKKGTIRDNLADPRMPRSLIWITPAIGSVSDGERMSRWRERLGLSEGTGLTMRRLRTARWYLAALSGRVFRFPSLYGTELLTVAKVAAALLQRGPPVDAHVRTLRTMRRLEAA